MIEEYIKLLESFKEHKISKIIESVNSKILAALNSPKFNPEIATYLKKRNKTGVPFTDFAEDPDSVSQIKKLINALYYARLTFLDLENINIREWSRSLSDLKLLYSKTIHKAYQASFLLTHLDVDLRGIFNDELSLLVPVFSKLQSISGQVTTRTYQIGETLKKYPISSTTGFVTGTAITKMQPQGGDIDYDFLTQFSAVLPGYINQFTQYLSQYSSQLVEKESTLNKEKLLELQNAAYRLLTNLDNLKAKSFFAPLKILNYIHIIRHVITLSMSSLEQVGNLSESSQDLIRGYLTTLKYDVLPTLFGLVDKIEDNSMLKPGTLSIPLMQSVNPLYEWLIYYASKPVNFAAKGEELLSIEDSRFLSLRLDRTYKRIDEANKSLFKIQKAQLALNEFFELIEDPVYKEYTIAKLPDEVKATLLQHYKIIRPYMEKIDVDLNNAIIDGLNAPESWTSYATTYVLKPARWAIGKQTGHLDFIKANKASLQELISKDRASKKFHIKLNEDLIESVQKQSDITLFPYNGENPFIIDESQGLSPDQGDISALAFASTDGVSKVLVEDESNLSKLTSEQALDLYQWYRNKHNKFIKARDAYLQFVALLNQQKNPKSQGNDVLLTFNQLDKDVKAECRNLYNIFQPYFTCGVTPDKKVNALAIDKYLSHLFSDKETATLDLPISIFQQFDEHFQTYFTKIGLSWNKKSKHFLKLAESKYHFENEATVLRKDENVAHRAHHLIQHTNYSKFVHEFRVHLYPLISILNEPMRAQLVAQDSGIPFPELEDHNLVLRQPKQVIALKRIFNSLYHVEAIVLALESLSNKQSESRYVYHLLQGYNHINEIMKLTKDIYTDPHFKLIGHQLFDRAQTLFAVIQEHSDAYQVSHDNVLQTETVTNNSLWYVLNTFFISPNHIRTIRNNSYVTKSQHEELHRNAKRATLQIEAIIKSANSYFKLFLQTPKMYALYANLTNKLTEFTSTTHDTVISNLDKFNSTVFTPMLIEADHWEDKLGLEPGLLSGPLKQIIDEYFKGFLTPLDLQSKEHIELFCNNSPLAARQKVAEKRIQKATKQIKKADKTYHSVELLYSAIEYYDHLCDEQYPGTDAEIAAAREDLVLKFKKTLPILVQLEKRVNPAPGSLDFDIDLDNLLNRETNDYDPKFNNIRALVTGCHHYYHGIRQTFEMKSSISEAKLKYLNILGEQQEQDDINFINQYVEASFNKHMDDYCIRDLGLQFVDEEYRTHLRGYLLSKKDIIIQQSKSNEDISSSISNLLKEQITVFEKNNFANYYHLDTIEIAIAQFRLYFSSANTAIVNGTSVFESEETLAKKTRLIKKIKDIASSGKLSIMDRIDSIKAQVELAQFKGILLAHKSPDFLSLNYLKQCFYSLLEALHLFTPTRKKLYINVNNAVNTSHQMSDLTTRFGLFSTTTRKPIEELESPDLPKALITT